MTETALMALRSGCGLGILEDKTCVSVYCSFLFLVVVVVVVVLCVCLPSLLIIAVLYYARKQHIAHQNSTPQKIIVNFQWHFQTDFQCECDRDESDSQLRRHCIVTCRRKQWTCMQCGRTVKTLSEDMFL